MCLSLVTLMFIVRTGLLVLVELIDLVNSVIVLLHIPNCDSDSPALLDIFISSDASICSTMAFPPLENSDHVIVSVSIEFLSNSIGDTSFYYKAYDYSCADWYGLCNHLRDVLREDIFKLGAFATAS